ncbi:ABC transporter permease [Candidatus Kaiserbacteria bacterium]|nr:ABC transporter permease [Candidatus Kaiserbacteria bacterium]
MNDTSAKNFSEPPGYEAAKEENPRHTPSHDDGLNNESNEADRVSGEFFREVNAVMTIALRDLTKLFRDRPRLVAGLIFPIIFIGVLGGGLNASFGKVLDYDFLTFVFTGVLAQTMFTSTASGVISLVQDRENDFSRELFVAPISRYTIVIGKIAGESLVSLWQAIGVMVFGLIIGVPLTVILVLKLLPILLIISFLGGAFGILVLANLGSQRTANQIFPFLIFPQFFLAGVFNPITALPLYLSLPSKLVPLTYAVDFLRSIYFRGSPAYEEIVLFSPVADFVVIAVVSLIFLVAGTYLFARSERNR